MRRPGAAARLRARGQSTAVVVGAGVSGCACAAVLAGEGIHVTLLNSALDRVNLPGYGPEIVTGGSGWHEIGETMAMLPLALRQAWLSSAVAPASGEAVLIVDRRAVSIETKRALERMPGLQFRQGLVTGLRIDSRECENLQDSSDSDQGRSAKVVVETVFGEMIEADAVILAVGLGLGGRISVGADSLRGGRYGETPADGLGTALEVLGASFSQVGLEVGASFPSTVAGLVEALVETNQGSRPISTVAVRVLAGRCGSGQPVTARLLPEEVRRVLAEVFLDGPTPDDAAGGAGAEDVREAGADDLRDRNGTEDFGGHWPQFHPPAVHWSEELPIERVIVAKGADGVVVPLVSPDGRATAEIHLSPEGGRVRSAAAAGFRGKGEVSGAEGPMASRLEHTVSAQVLGTLGPDGGLTLKSGGKPPVWVTGRAAGASSYLSSLRSGALVGAEVARALSRGGGDSG